MYLGKNPESVSDAALIKAVIPQHTAKRLARLMGHSLKTAQHWLYYGPACGKRRELAIALLAEYDREEEKRASIRRRLLEWAAEE
jgi:hypothetical protein